MRPAIILGYRAELDSDRARNWTRCRASWEELGWPILAGDADESAPFDLTSSRNVAAGLEPWNVALVIDADVMLCEPDGARAAVELAHASGRYVAAHHELCYLTKGSTDDLCSGAASPWGAHYVEMTATWLVAFAIRRDLWDLVGGYDPRFRGYGFQGVAFLASVSAFRPNLARIAGRLLHLHHERARDERTHPHYEANVALADRYLRARGERDVLRLIGERPA